MLSGAAILSNCANMQLAVASSMTRAPSKIDQIHFLTKFTFCDQGTCLYDLTTSLRAEANAQPQWLLSYFNQSSKPLSDKAMQSRPTYRKRNEWRY